MTMTLTSVLLTCSALAAFSGAVRFAQSRLRSRNPISWFTASYTALIHSLHSGTLGLIVGLVWSTRAQEVHPAIPMIVAGAIGITGMDIAQLLKTIVIKALQSMLAGLLPNDKQDNESND